MPAAASEKLSEINRELSVALVRFAHEVDEVEGPNVDSAKKWVEIDGKLDQLSNVAMGELEAEFRRLLGDHPSS